MDVIIAMSREHQSGLSGWAMVYGGPAEERAGSNFTNVDRKSIACS